MEAMKIAVVGATGRVGRHIVDVLEAGGHQAVPISRSHGLDVITAEGLDDALRGVECVIDVSTWPTPDEQAATAFFTTAARNLNLAGERAGVKRIVTVSIIGADRFSGGYNVAKVAQERALRDGPIPARILRAAQFHEFVEELLGWGQQGDVSYLPRMRTQLVAARSVAEAVVELATEPEPIADESIPEIAGPRVETLVEMARLVAARRGGPERVEEISQSDDPDAELFAGDGLLPGPGARLVGPTYAEWLESVTAPTQAP